MTPGDDPLVSLAIAWKDKPGFVGTARPVEAIARDLDTYDAFRDLIDRLIPLERASSRRVLFVDQLEELLIDSELDPKLSRARRQQFAGYLVSYVREDPRNLLITTIWW